MALAIAGIALLALPGAATASPHAPGARDTAAAPDGVRARQAERLAEARRRFEPGTTRRPSVGVRPRAASAQGAAAADGFVPLAPARILDTRSGNGAPKARLGAGGTVTVQVTGRGGIPATGVAAVVVNLTAVTPTVGTYLSAYPSGSPRPATSNVSVPKGVTTATSAVVTLGAGGTITVFNAAGTLDVLADVSGYFLTGGEYQALTPTRLLDTRNGVGAAKGAVGARKTVTVAVAGKADVPTTGVAAVVGTLTVVGPTAGTYAVAYPAGQPRPGASTVNAPAKRTVANSTIIKLGTGGAVTLYNAAGSAHLLFDVAGYLTTGGTYVAITPTRVVDTRGEEYGDTPLSDRQQESFLVTGVGGDGDLPALPALNVSAVVVNLTAVKPTASTFLGTGPSVAPITTSTVNTAGGTTVANLAVVKVGAGGMIDVLNARGDTHVIIDVVGYFTSARTPQLAVGETVAVATRADGTLAASMQPVGVSADGRYVAFDSHDIGITPYGNVSTSQSTYVRDTALGWTADAFGLPGVDSTGTGLSSDGGTLTMDAALVGEPWTLASFPFTGGGDVAGLDTGGDPVPTRGSGLSANGRWVVYASGNRLLRRDLTSDAVVAVGSVCPRTEDCRTPAVSDDGNAITYDVVIGGRTRRVNRITMSGNREPVPVSAARSGDVFPVYSVQDFSVSADGRDVVLSVPADGLVRDTGYPQVFLKDTVTQELTLVSVDSDGGPSDNSSYGATISADGSTIAFQSAATDLAAERHDLDSFEVYVRDRVSGATTLVSRSRGGAAFAELSINPKLSATGAWLTYSTVGKNIVPGSGNFQTVVLTRLK